MKKTVLTFGLIAGVIISVLMDSSLLLADKIGPGHSMVSATPSLWRRSCWSTSASAAIATTVSPAKSPSAAPSPAAS